MKLRKFIYKSVKSTNLTALKKIRTGSTSGIIRAYSQTHGRGRYGKRWISSKGNLFISIFFEIDLKTNLKKINNLNIKFISNFLNKIVNKKVSIKKPNDILINGSKICGILQEIITQNKKKYMILGIGINKKSSPAIKKYKTTYIDQHIKKNISNVEIFNSIRKLYEKKIGTLYKCT